MTHVDVADNELKAKHRTMWGKGDYPRMVDTFLLPIGQRLVDAAQVGPGARVLDVAAGTGNASIPAAQRGPGSRPATSPLTCWRPARSGPRLPASTSSGWRPTPSACPSTTRPSTS